jgi:large subunit ribosomal protein L21
MVALSGETAMYAVIETGGKQYKVTSGDRIEVELLDSAVNSKCVFDKVLFLSGEAGSAEAGSPYIKGVKVTGKVLEHIKSEKVTVYKMKRRKSHRKRRGHRQQMTVVQITDIVR